jgi:UDPglucose 6-dehydrogenase
VNVCVFGCWHLGSVTAAGLASLGHRVTCLDPDPTIIEGLKDGEPPVAEPGLAEALAEGRDRGLVSYTTDAVAALKAAEMVWVTFDTPVSENDRGDAQWVIERIIELLERDAHTDTIVLVSSQLPVGSIAELERRHADLLTERRAVFAYSPENLRLGRALDSFLRPDSLIVGTRHDTARKTVGDLLGTITDKLIWMSVESAEMSKHALNAFLATSIAFTNEIAVLCERTGADARQVEVALRADPRVGPRAYAAPGAAYAGGTLGRDIAYLAELATSHEASTPVLNGVQASNRAHESWSLDALESELGNLAGRRVAVLGLTYTPGTSTLRRSAAVELCTVLLERGAIVRAHDPGAEALPPTLGGVDRQTSAKAAIADTDAVVVATGWPEYRSLDGNDFTSRVVIDADGLLAESLMHDKRVRYRSVGTAT